MADSHKYYYMRLKDDYFAAEEQLTLESLPDGYLYSNILLKLYLLSLKSNGRLMVNNCIPYSAEMIAKATGHQVSVVSQALMAFEKLGLIEVLDNGAIYMLALQGFVGSSSTDADRKRLQDQQMRAEKKSLALGGEISGEISEKSPPEIRDKSIEFRSQRSESRDQSSEKKIYPPTQPSVVCPPKGGTRKFVKPSLDEVRSLCEERGYTLDPQSFLDHYDSNGWRVGKNPMKDWKASLANWQRNEKESPRAVQPRSVTRGDMNYLQHDYSSVDYDSFKGENKHSQLEELMEALDREEAGT